MRILDAEKNHCPVIVAPLAAVVLSRQKTAEASAQATMNPP
jgi:hypothetical protein